MHLKRDDRGVTLPEVLVAITILAIIVVPLGDALIGLVRNTDGTTRRMNESRDIQLATTYFARDVQNIGVRNWAQPTLPLLQSINNTAYECAGTGTRVVSLAWDDPTGATGSTVTRVTYRVRTLDGELQLTRTWCNGTTSGSIAPPANRPTHVLVHNLASAPPSGQPVCADAAGTVIPCTGAGPSLPQQVTLTLSVQDPGSAAPVSITLTGQRRQS